MKRVPKRLRGRHAKEMADDNTPTVTSRRRKPTPHMRLRLDTAKRLQTLSQKNAERPRSKRKGDKITPNKVPVENTIQPPPAPNSRFKKRQTHKTWLPTHIWHAKRAHMVTRWKFAIAESPTEKSYRPTHRASTLRGAVVWDQSYYATVLVKGKEREVAYVLKELLSREDAEIVAHKGPIRRGRRSWQGWVFEQGGYPTKPIAPVTLLWCTTTPKGSIGISEDGDRKATHRRVFLRVHPSAFHQLWATIMSVAKPYSSVTTEDLRFEIGSIEITGPAATDTLLACLHPREEHNTANSPNSPESVWQGLCHLTNPSALPPGAFLAFDVADPRIRFPPRLSPLSGTKEENMSNLFRILSTWSVDGFQPSPGLFSREARNASLQAQSPQKRINKRKAEAMPGKLPDSAPTDPYIPAILLANRNPSQFTYRNQRFPTTTSNAIGSWTLLLPWNWVLPVWYSIVHVPAVRFGGLLESKQLNHENGVLSFPDDLPGTRSGFEEEKRKAGERKEKWEKKPRRSRVAWESINLGEGRKGEIGRGDWCDWDYLSDLVSKEMNTEEDYFTVHSQPDTQSAVAPQLSENSMDTSDASTALASQIPLLPNSSTATFTASQPLPSPFHKPFSPWTIPMSLVLPLLSHPHVPLQPPLSFLSQETLAKGLFSVKITCLHCGTPLERARVYRFPTKFHNPQIFEGWENLLASHDKYEASKRMYRKDKNNKLTNSVDVTQKYFHDRGASRSHTILTSASPLKPGHEEYPVVPGEEDLIGFITSGNYNMKEARGTGIAGLSFSRVFGEWITGDGSGSGRIRGEAKGVSRTCIVRDVGQTVGRLARWELI